MIRRKPDVVTRALFVGVSNPTPIDEIRRIAAERAAGHHRAIFAAIDRAAKLMLHVRNEPCSASVTSHMSTEPEYTTDDAQEIFFGEHADFDESPVAEIDMGTSRWHHSWTYIVRRTEDGTLWGVDGSLALTEMQEHEFYDPPYRVDTREETIPARVVTTYWVGDKKIG